MKRILAFSLALLMLFVLSACNKEDPIVTVGPDTADTEPEQEHTHEEGENEYDPAPDFTVYDADGKPVKLSDMKGKPVVLNFWASWCPPCKAEMPDFDAVCKEYEGKVIFMMVNLTDGERETVESARNFIHMMEYSFPVYYDTTLDAAATYGVRGLPSTAFISAEGNIIAARSGAMSYDILMGGIDLIYHP